MRTRWVTRIGVTGALVVLAGVPLIELVRHAASAIGSGAGRVLADGGSQAIVNSLATSTVATGLAVVLGAGAALVTERSLGSRALRLGLLMPLLVPPFVSALGFARAFGPGGLLDDAMGITVPGVVGPGGVTAVLAIHAAPLVYLVVAASLRSRARPELEWAGRASGASAWTVLRRITVPLLAPAVAGGAALAFIVSMNSFGIPAVLGIPAGFATMTTRIYSDLARSSDPAAFDRVLVLSVVLVLVVLVAVLLADRMVRRAVPLRSAGAAREPRWELPRRRAVSIPVWGYLLATTAVPLAAVVLTAMTRAVGLAAVPSNWSGANFAEAWSTAATRAAGRTVVLAASAAAIATVLGLALAVGIRRRSAWTGGVVAATFAIPGSALAVAVLLAYGSWIRDTVVIILVAYLAKFWALSHRAVAGSVQALEIDMVHAARVSGAGAARTLRIVVVPLLRAAIGAAWLLVFLFGLHELTMSSLLYGPGTETLAVHILNVQQLGDITVTCALATIITLPGVIAAVILTRRRSVA